MLGLVMSISSLLNSNRSKLRKDGLILASFQEGGAVFHGGQGTEVGSALVHDGGSMRQLATCHGQAGGRKTLGWK